MTKNLLDTNESKRPTILDDRTGQYVTDPRLTLAETLAAVYEVNAKMAEAKPSIHMYAQHFAIQAMCAHFGWTTYEVAAAEQYVSLLNTNGSAASAG